MSSTARGSQRSEADNYPTPAWVTHRLLERLKLPGGAWLESSAGEGGIIKAVNAVRKDVRWSACELRKKCRPALLKAGVKDLNLCSFLDVLPHDFGTPAVCINNPPFSMAMQFIEHSLKFAPWVIHLLRLNFLGTEKRNKFFQTTMPDVYVVPDRISFTGDGRADSIEYAWLVFGPKRGRRVGKIEVLNTTPVAERR